MLEQHNNTLIACHKVGNEYIATNNVAGDKTKTYAPTADLAIEAMKQLLDGNDDGKND